MPDIDKQIKRIPNYFYYAMAGELVSIFGPDILKDQEDCSYYDLRSGTMGWNLAFLSNCRKLDMQWLIDSWRKDTEQYNEIIENKIIERFCKKDHSKERFNCYFQYLLVREEEW